MDNKNWEIHLLVGFFLAPGALLLFAGLVAGPRTRAFERLALRAQGTVIAIADDSEGVPSFPEVEFETPDGRRHKFVSGSGASRSFMAGEPFKVGDRVPVLYASGDPDSGARIGTFGEKYHLAKTLIWTGVIFTLIAGAVWDQCAKAGLLH